MSFRLVQKSMTLNDLERLDGLLRYFAELGSSQGALRVKVVEDTPTLSATEM